MIMIIFISIYFKGDNMDKIKAINLLISLEKRQGEHNGRWEMNEYILEDLCYTYFDDITAIADECHINYGTDEEIEKELKEYEKDCIFPRDEWTFDLKQKIEEYLINIILGDNNE